MRIRLAEHADSELLLKQDRHISPAELGELIERGRIFIGEWGTDFLGWLRYSFFWDQIPFLNMLYILEPERGKGHGTELLSFWERKMKEAGHSRLMTSTVSEEYAQHFYVEQGYQAVGGFLLPGEPYEIILTKEIKWEETVKNHGLS